MLEFIVLGQVPGTEFRITFSWVLLTLGSLVALLLIREREDKPQKSAGKKRRFSFLRRVQSTEHTA